MSSDKATYAYEAAREALAMAKHHDEQAAKQRARAALQLEYLRAAQLELLRDEVQA
jgi:hypothetical protein